MKNISLQSAAESSQSGTPGGELTAIQLSILKWLLGAIEKDATLKKKNGPYVAGKKKSQFKLNDCCP